MSEQGRMDLPRITGPLPGPRARAIIARDARVVSPSYTRAYPLVAARGEGAIVEDADGNRFLDFNAGIAVVATGHSHPRVVAAIQEQAARLVHMSGTDFYYEPLVALAEKLAALAPGPAPRRVAFGNSGAEAVECALKLARYATGRDKFIAFLGGFHGRTLGALSLNSEKWPFRARSAKSRPQRFHGPIGPCETISTVARALWAPIFPGGRLSWHNFSRVGYDSGFGRRDQKDRVVVGEVLLSCVGGDPRGTAF
jgi:4-aminobutyrate aminotransferase